ncbi:hypothetical protein FACS1894202_04490 [Clostridia bacterium]|nr:hypothetical protein FACS1894202_04490 [Clostridia bacterium]
MKRFRLNGATRLALFSALLIAGTLLATLAIGGYLNSDGAIIVVAAVAAIVFALSYVVSSLIIDRALNPLRAMTEKIKAVGRDGNYNTKIFVDFGEDELRICAAAFNEMTSKVNEHIASQRRFISDASHELVTPVAVISGHADMLLRWGKDDPEKLSESLNIIKKEALSMAALVDDLLFLSRSDNRKLAYDFQSVELSPLAAECAAERKLINPDAEITVTGSGVWNADEPSLKRVLRILLDNAVKYGGKHIKITVSDTSLSVADDGIGIAPEHVRKIFGRFYRADDSRAKATGGSGLGLAIAREIVAAHGKTIRAESEVGSGTEIFIESSP